jgi:hypothetical protein
MPVSQIGKLVRLLEVEMLLADQGPLKAKPSAQGRGLSVLDFHEA